MRTGLSYSFTVDDFTLPKKMYQVGYTLRHILMAGECAVARQKATVRTSIQLERLVTQWTQREVAVLHVLVLCVLRRLRGQRVQVHGLELSTTASRRAREPRLQYWYAASTK